MACFYRYSCRVLQELVVQVLITHIVAIEPKLQSYSLGEFGLYTYLHENPDASLAINPRKHEELIGHLLPGFRAVAWN
jgi:hypothetical protein